MDKALFEVVDFMENIEGAEQQEKEKASRTKSDKKVSKDKTSSGKKKPTHFCKHHGPNWSHDTEDCKVLKGEKSGGGGYSNKTWTRKASEERNKSKKELATLIAKAVNKGVKKQLAAVDKKRKSGDSSEEECYLVDTLTQDLDGFNYEAMEKLSVDDVDDEISV